ncbi:uncharacterized protein M421DRAFT_396719 [Didymella exigua CBS 183.55]|uniref:DUF6594 domain-containing protein n=1 Tax=Didymella exigua CBS 183.55 TaxID=1150837 RepID=A0A6A5RLG2_9PLEO|nr:uncharacterized protein M421DRAFT_396719 [Didymella exigua CBS 183.55]KAF1926377.1 hypothetical protein M421DRAFT_396719 [Didymella exigua CBS 183.55]
MDHESEHSTEGKTYDYGDAEKSGMVGHGSRRGIPPAEHRKDAEVQMEVTDAKGQKSWVRFKIRGEPQRNPGKFWQYQLNCKKDGAQYSGDKWFSKGKEVDPEQGVPRSPTDSTNSDNTLGFDSRRSTAVDSNVQCSEKIEPAPVNETENLEEYEDPAVVKYETSLTTSIPVHRYPIGYPRLAAFLSSESSFSIYRSYNYLHSRVILSLQNEINELEVELGRLDDADDNEEDADKLASGRRSGAERTALLDKIREKLVRYDEIMAKARDLNAFQRPSDRDYRSLRQWYYRKTPLVDRESTWIKLRDDLVTLRQGREWAGFDGWIESWIKRLPFGLERYFTTEALKEKSDDPLMRYYNPARVEKLVGVFITLIIFVLLIMPVVAMYKLTCIGNRKTTIDAVGLLVVFTLLFSAAMSLLTKAKRHELFAASAAYCAVLVVFISNFNNDSNPVAGSRGA